MNKCQHCLLWATELLLLRAITWQNRYRHAGLQAKYEADIQSLSKSITGLSHKCIMNQTNPKCSHKIATPRKISYILDFILDVTWLVLKQPLDSTTTLLPSCWGWWVLYPRGQRWQFGIFDRCWLPCSSKALRQICRLSLCIEGCPPL